MNRDEISLKDAAEYLPKPDTIRASPGAIVPLDDPEAKRAREVGSAGATLEAMLVASRHGKTVKGQQ